MQSVDVVELGREIRDMVASVLDARDAGKDEKDEALAEALKIDDVLEALGMESDERVTCWTCQDWADHAHDLFNGERIELDVWLGIAS